MYDSLVSHTARLCGLRARKVGRWRWWLGAAGKKVALLTYDPLPEKWLVRFKGGRQAGSLVECLERIAALVPVMA